MPQQKRKLRLLQHSNARLSTPANALRSRVTDTPLKSRVTNTTLISRKV